MDMYRYITVNSLVKKPCELWFLQDLVELELVEFASLLCQHWLSAKPDYVITIMPKNQQISADKL